LKRKKVKNVGTPIDNSVIEEKKGEKCWNAN